MGLDEIAFGKKGAKPAEQLSTIVLQLEELLSQLMENPEFDEYFYGDVRQSMCKAWKSVAPRFEAYAAAVQEAAESDLATHGLTGDELEFKVEAINFVARRFFKLGELSTLSRRKKWLRKLLEIIDKLLKSILDAVPGGGAISEYKDFCESLIPDDDDDDE